jgi:isochorismate synthase
MSDILKYRIPGSEKIQKSGYFREIKSMKEANGFFMTTFLKDRLIEFVPSTNTEGKETFFTSEPYTISKENYLKDAQNFINLFEEKKIKKAVLSRVKKVDFNEKKITDFFHLLCETYPKAFVYLVSGEAIGTWIGATPEILIHTFSNSGFTMSLAGTKSVEDKDKEWGEKEILEQAYVTGFIQDKLLSLGIKGLEINGPYDVETGPVIHLKTDISFDLEPSKVVELAKSIHPTPAVSGLPQKEAIEIINYREPHDREFYTGMIGLITPSKTNLYVNLRCCQIQKGVAYLYLGGGFTKDSKPLDEWNETENKSRTLLNVIENL